MGSFRTGKRRFERTADGNLRIRPFTWKLEEAGARRFNRARQYVENAPAVIDQINRMVKSWFIFHPPHDEIWEVDFAYMPPDFLSAPNAGRRSNSEFWRLVPVGTICYIDEAKKARLASEEELAKLEAELAAARAETDAIKAGNAAKADVHDYDEETTRDTFIDTLLHEAGWPLDQKQDREFPVTGMPSATGGGSVDYVLWGAGGKPLGAVEAKRTRKDARIGQQQAKLYADCLEAQFGQRPVIFYTNGFEHWMWDDLRSPPRLVEGFYTRDELQLIIQRRQSRRSPSVLDVDDKIVERYYQHRAIRKVVESFDRDGLRKSLLVMATGSGKTRTAVALCDLLMRANWVKRVLFLADRRALVKQAVNAFKQHLPWATTVNLLTEKNEKGLIYVSTYATMMGLIDQNVDGRRAFGVGHFDLVVIDEAHRSVYRKYGAIFSYFDSYLIGLTATPKDEVDRDTYRLFRSSARTANGRLQP